MSAERTGKAPTSMQDANIIAHKTKDGMQQNLSFHAENQCHAFILFLNQLRVY